MVCKMNINENRRDLEQYKRILRFSVALCMIAFQTGVFTYFWYEKYNQLIRKPFEGKGNILMVFLYIFLVIVFTATFGGLKIGYLKKMNIIWSQLLSAFCVNILITIQIILMSGRISKLGNLTTVTLVMMVFDIIIIVIGINFFDGLYYSVFPPRTLLLLFDDRDPASLINKIHRRKDKYMIGEQISVKSDPEVLKAKILESEGVILCDIHAKERNRILKFCYEYSIRTYTTPKISDIVLKNSEILHLFDTPLLLSRNTGLSFEQKLFKRMIDIVSSALILLITSPVILITAILIKLYDRGPVLFKQCRVTQDGKEFFVYKFRSMIVNAEKNGVAVLATKNDSRITPIGNFIRKVRIDELPQLWNILIGDMSLVGPRPERPEIMEQYLKKIPEFSNRLKVKAGLSGYAQVYGKYNTTAYDKLKLDLMYIENYSLLMDIRIILLTIKILFMEESTEGMEENQTVALIDDSDLDDD